MYTRTKQRRLALAESERKGDLQPLIGPSRYLTIGPDALKSLPEASPGPSSVLSVSGPATKRSLSRGAKNGTTAGAGGWLRTFSSDLLEMRVPTKWSLPTFLPTFRLEICLKRNGVIFNDLRILIVISICFSNKYTKIEIS